VATITDLAGNTDSAERTIVLDTEAPVVTAPAADPDTINTGIEREVTFSANVTDGDGTGIDSVSIDLSSLGGEADQAMTEGEEEGVYEYTWEDLTVEEAGEYVLYITATDVVGNSDNTTSITLTVITDLDDPVIESTTVEYPLGYESARVGDDVIITAVVTDNTTEIVSVTIDATGIGLTDAETLEAVEGEEDTYSATLEVGDVDADTYTLTITATDLAGNDATEDVTVTVVAELTAYNLELEEGWNLISLPLIPDDEDIATILADITDNVSQVRTFLYEDGGLVEYFWLEGGAVGALDEMVDGQGYWIEMTVARTLVINGTESVVGQSIPPYYDVYEGWNLIGFKAVDAGAAEDYLGTSVTNISERMYGYNAAGSYYVRVDIEADNLEPGQGYWLAVSADGTIYP